MNDASGHVRLRSQKPVKRSIVLEQVWRARLVSDDAVLEYHGLLGQAQRQFGVLLDQYEADVTRIVTCPSSATRF